MAALDSGQIEDFIDQFQQVPTGPQDLFYVVVLLFSQGGKVI